jgi:hypothetical protein
VDIDWEYPVGGGLSGNVCRPADKHNFTLLLQKLREKLDEQGTADRKHYLLTIAAGAGDSYLKNVELSAIHNYLDYALIMTYDFHGTWDPYTDLIAPLYNNASIAQYKGSVDSVIKNGKKLPSNGQDDHGRTFYVTCIRRSATSIKALPFLFPASAVGYDAIADHCLNRKAIALFPFAVKGPCSSMAHLHLL